jgi:hypothetical protein
MFGMNMKKSNGFEFRDLAVRKYPFINHQNNYLQIVWRRPDETLLMASHPESCSFRLIINNRTVRCYEKSLVFRKKIRFYHL